MAQREVALYKNKYIGIESIFTVAEDGSQINIPEKVEALRRLSRNNELFCTCGCGSNLILVAGDRNLREQHFRLKDGNENINCTAISESKISTNSKIILKCWLDDKLNSNDVETRIHIKKISDSTRNYELSFLSKSKKLAISYCKDRNNLNDEKLSILDEYANSYKIHYIVDKSNLYTNGQYPEFLIKIQKRQKYCLFLEVDDFKYNEAVLYVAYFDKDIDNRWTSISIVSGYLKDYSFNNENELLYKNDKVINLYEKTKTEFINDCNIKRQKRIAAKKAWEAQQASLEAARIKQIEERKKQEAELVEKRKEAFEKQQKVWEDYLRQEKQKQEALEREEKERAYKLAKKYTCKICGKVGTMGEFSSFGGVSENDLGICSECSRKKADNHKKISTTSNGGIFDGLPDEIREKNKKGREEINKDICPNCGGLLILKHGPYGDFYGCENYPICKYTEKANNK